MRSLAPHILVISQISRRCVLRSNSGLCLGLAPSAFSCASAAGRSPACAGYRILQPRWPRNRRLAPSVARPVAPVVATRRIAPVSYTFQRRPWSNFRIAPDVILRLPGVTNLRLAPLIRHSVPTYHAALGSRRLPHSSPVPVANLRPSPEPDLQLAHHVTSGLHRTLQASASPVTQHSACAERCVPPAKLATSP